MPNMFSYVCAEEEKGRPKGAASKSFELEKRRLAAAGAPAFPRAADPGVAGRAQGPRETASHLVYRRIVLGRRWQAERAGSDRGIGVKGKGPGEQHSGCRRKHDRCFTHRSLLRKAPASPSLERGANCNSIAQNEAGVPSPRRKPGSKNHKSGPKLLWIPASAGMTSMKPPALNPKLFRRIN
jgi:hypothetical protein